MVGAKASQHFSMCSGCQATQQIIAVLRVAHTISAPHHACACCTHIHAYLLPSSSHGPHSRSPSHASAVQHVTMCLACGSGALRRPAFSFLHCFVPPWRPFYPDQPEPTLVSSNPPPPFAPVSPGLLLCGSLSYSLPPNLSCSPLRFSPVAPLSSFPAVLYPLSLSLFLSPSLSRPKRGFGLFRASLSPPGFEPSSTGQKRCGVSTEPRRWGMSTMAPCAPVFFSFVSPPVMRIFFRMGVCSAACRGTAQRPRVPGPPA